MAVGGSGVGDGVTVNVGVMVGVKVTVEVRVMVGLGVMVGVSTRVEVDTINGVAVAVGSEGKNCCHAQNPPVNRPAQIQMNTAAAENGTVAQLPRFGGRGESVFWAGLSNPDGAGFFFSVGFSFCSKTPLRYCPQLGQVALSKDTGA